MIWARILLWVFQVLNIGAFIFMQWHAGRFTHKQYVWFAVCSMLGAGATAVDAGIGGAWGAAATQGFFCGFFIFGIAKRIRIMKIEQRIAS